MVNIIVIEDQTLLRDTLVQALNREEDFHVIGEWDKGEEALKALSNNRSFELAIVDYALPGMDGITLTRKLKELNPAVKVIIISMYQEERNIFDAFEAGVMGYLPKTISIGDLVASVRNVSNGEAVINRRIAKRFIKYVIDMKNRPLESSFDEEKLQILELIKEGYSNKEISERLNLSLPTVKFRVREICTRLNARDRTQAAVEAIRLGLLSLRKHEI